MRILRLSIIILTFLFFSCATDDNDEIIDPVNLAGIWNLTSLETQNGQAIITDGGITISADFSISTSNEGLQITFSEDPNVVSSEGSFTQTTMVTVIGQTETEETIVDDVFLDGNWQLNGDNLTITSGDAMLDEFNPSFEIVRLTETELELRQNLDQEVSFEENDIQTSGILVIILNR